MKNFLPYARLALLAGLTSLTLTSCFDHDKKCDPQPKNQGQGRCGTPTAPTTTGSGGSN